MYNLQEPCRWIVDTTVISCLEHNRFKKRDFFRMDNYVLRLAPEAVKRFLEMLRFSFYSSVPFEGKHYHWDTIVLLKAQELARFIEGRARQFNFVEPAPNLAKEDCRELRERIRTLSTSEARKLGIRKNTLWYMKKRAREKKSLVTYSKVSRKLSCAHCKVADAASHAA